MGMEVSASYKGGHFSFIRHYARQVQRDSCSEAVYWTCISCEGTAHQLLPLSFLGFLHVTSMLEILQGGPKVLDIIL